MPGSSTHDPSTTSDSSLPPNKPRQKRKQKLTGSDSSGSKKKDNNAKDSGGVVAAVTSHRAKLAYGGAFKDANPPDEFPVPQFPELQPAKPAEIPTNGNSSASPLLDAASATSVSASTAPSANDWARVMGPLAGSPSNLISIMGDSPPTQPSSYEDSRGLSYAWNAQQQQQQQQWRHVNNKPYSASPPAGGRRPLSFQMEHFPNDLRSQASSPPGARRSSMHSPFMPSRAVSNPPLPHQPQAHFYGAPDIDFDMHNNTGLKAGERGFYFGFDTLPRLNNVQTAGNDHVVLAGYEGGMDIYSVNKRGVEPLITLKGLRGGVYNAKILPWNGTSDPFGIFPLVAVVVHGPVPPLSAPEIALEPVFDNDSSLQLEGIQTPPSETNQRQAGIGKSMPIIEYYQTSVEVYSLATSQLIDVLLQAPKTPIKASVTSPVFRSPQSTGAFQVRAEDGGIVVASGTTGECWVYRQVRYEQEPGYRFSCIGKLWTSLQQGLKIDSTVEDDSSSSSVPPRKRPQTPIFAVSGRWLAYCPPPASSQIALNALIPVPVEGKGPGLSTLTAPVLPNESAEVEQPISDGVVNRIMRETTQEVIQGARWVGKQSLQLWNNYWKTGQQPPARQPTASSPPWGSAYPARPEAGQFPPTYGVSGQAVTKEPGLVSIVDMHALMGFATIHPTTTFKPPLGCSFMSFSPTGASLFTASIKGDVQTVWDLMRIQYTKSSPLQNTQSNNGHLTRVRQVAQFSRMTVARVVDVTWARPTGERAAMVTDRGTVHLLDMPPSTYTWPPPRRRAAAPDASRKNSENASAVSIASNVISSAYGATRPLLNSHRRSASSAQGTPTIMNHASYGGKVLAAGISHSLGNAGTAINHLRHTGENRVSLPLRNMSAGPSCAIWIAGKKHHTLFVVGDGQVRMFLGKGRGPSTRRDRQRVTRGSRYSDFKLRDLPNDLIAPSIKQIIDPIEDLDLATPDHDGGNTLVLHPRQRLSHPDHSPEAAIPQAEIESNAPYQPFHTDRRVGLHIYKGGSHGDTSSSAVRRTGSAVLDGLQQKGTKHRRQKAAVSQAWAFGRPIRTIKLDLGLPVVVEEDISNSIHHRALPVSAMERVLQVGGNDEQIVVTTRRRRGGNRGVDADEDGFFEDDCEVLDFADQRV